jgi:hypothetical protein
MRKYKSAVILILALFFMLSCSLLDDLKEKVGGGENEKEEIKSENVKEETVGKTSKNDLQYYNKYIEVLNKISETVEQFHKAYISDVPDPKTLKKESMVFAIASDVYADNIERLVKEYNRSLFDNGELAKLKPDNDSMRLEIESNFKDVLITLEDYYKLAREVINYYKNKGYQKDLALAGGYDQKMTNEYERYKEAFDKFNASVKKYKPPRKSRDPDKIFDPDEKSVAVLMNTYENTLDGAEAFYEQLQVIDKDSDVSELSNMLDTFETKFTEDTRKVESTTFTDRTKYMKYNFEDYFTKTVNDFVTETRKFFEAINKKKMDSKSFNNGYDNVIRYYNYMIGAYNSSIGSLNTFSSFD